ncbi:DUF190 domain-containing protein [Candidatus Formimonas warabiya]|uniref:DUF190 domain-containing protein n=1 Tax=Formimonas warabiya TaxID=1761012 RepID=UPI0011D092F7|nr:DUF190 domain-containing protein [Candidatus Formimonas warabiya]
MTKATGQAVRLKIYIGESDRYKGVPLYHAIVLKARELGLAGATVCRGIEGFGAHSRIHSARILDISSDLPISIDIIDSTEYIQMLLPFLDEVVKEGLVIMEDVNIIKYANGNTLKVKI